MILLFCCAAAATSACGRIGYTEVGAARSDGGQNEGDGATQDAARDGAQVDQDAGADASIGTVNLAFVSTIQYRGAELGGLQGADEKCTNEAVRAGRPGTYVALLRGGSTLRADRLRGARGWFLGNGRPFADTADDVVSGRHLYALLTDAEGSLVRFGLAFNGVTGADCGAWTGNIGGASASPITEVEGNFHTPLIVSCTTIARLMCLQVDHNTVVPPPELTAGARLGFVSDTPFIPGGGITGADSLCQADAARAGFSGTFLALLATTAGTAASRFNVSDPWFRPDGVQLAETATALFEGQTLSAFSVTGQGTRVTQTPWTGAATPTASAAATCGDWLQATGEGTVGDTATAGVGSFGPVRASCGAQPIYCLQN